MCIRDRPHSSTIAEVKTHISAIERVQHSKVVPSWRSAAARHKAKILLQDVISKTGKLTEEKKKLKEFFLQFGIVIDIDTMSEADVAKLQQADEIIAEATAIVPCCNNDSAYNLLDTIKQNAEKLSLIHI